MRFRAIVLDIEGTVGSAAHVHDVLFPYARARIGQWFHDHRGMRQADQLIAETRLLLNDAKLDEQGTVAALTAWSDDDVKAAPLKTLQAWIWSAGYANGDLRGHLYDEVPAVLRRWKQDGAALFVYSSGAIQAQRDWFAHTAYGDLSTLLTGFFDLTVAGSKKETGSYLTISRAIDVSPDQTLFLSDSAEELDAAGHAGWHTMAVRRRDDERPFPVPGHTTVRSLDAVDIAG